METTTQFPVDAGTLVSVTCSYSEAVLSGSSEVTCTTGRIYTFVTEPICPFPGQFDISSDRVGRITEL